MSLKVMDGAKTLAGATGTPDIAHADRTNTTVNSAAIDMSEHRELLVNVVAGTVDASQAGNVKIQESNDASTWSDVPDATVFSWSGASSSDKSFWASVDWRHPDRKRYARLVATFGATNSAAVGATSLRVSPTQHLDADGGIVAA